MSKLRAATVALISAAVLLSSGCGRGDSEQQAEPVTGSGEDRPTTLVMVPVSGFGVPPCGPTEVGDGDDVCLLLGTSWVNQSAIATARVATGPDGAAVHLLFTEDGIEAFNDIAAGCFAMTGDCETGRVAIVDGDGLVSSPQINAERFERDQLVITLGGDLDRAEELAEAING